MRLNRWTCIAFVGTVVTVMLFACAVLVLAARGPSTPEWSLYSSISHPSDGTYHLNSGRKSDEMLCVTKVEYNEDGQTIVVTGRHVQFDSFAATFTFTTDPGFMIFGHQAETMRYGSVYYLDWFVPDHDPDKNILTTIEYKGEGFPSECAP